MPRRNRVDPWGDFHVAASRGLFTGNRGCLVDSDGELVRHHSGLSWITCRTDYRDAKHPLDAPRTWTPLFFLDDAVALAAGHRPCGLCRRGDYLAYQRAVAAAFDTGHTVLAAELNERLSSERHRRGRGLVRARDRIVWTCAVDALPSGTVIVDCLTWESYLITEEHLQRFTFDGWGPPSGRPEGIDVAILTPATSVAALNNGFTPRLHPTACHHQTDPEA